MNYETITFNVESGVATVALNRPEALNALVPRMGEELADAMGRTRTDDTVRAVVVKGMGRVFCAGGDVKAFGEYLKGRPAGGAPRSWPATCTPALLASGARQSRS